jgi:hypothetical protein
MAWKPVGPVTRAHLRQHSDEGLLRLLVYGRSHWDYLKLGRGLLCAQASLVRVSFSPRMGLNI